MIDRFPPHPQAKSISDKIASASGHPDKSPSKAGTMNHMDTGGAATSSAPSTSSIHDDGDDDDNY